CRRYFAWGWLATAAAILLVSPAAPYSAGNAMTFRAGFVHWDSMRYIALLPILGWLALAFVLDAGAGARHWRTLAAILIAITALRTSGASPLVLLLLAPCAVLLATVGLPAIVWRPATVCGR